MANIKRQKKRNITNAKRAKKSPHQPAYILGTAVSAKFFQGFGRSTLEEYVDTGKAMAKNLGVMDMTAITMCREQKIPVLVFDFKAPGNIRRAIVPDPKDPIGTMIETGLSG